MSTTSTPPTVECHHPDCTAIGRKWELHHGKYCSNVCELKHTGREKLARFIYDHTLCYTCFQPLKTIEPPKPDFEFTERGHGWTRDDDGNPKLQFYSQEVTRDAACGFQHLTEHADKGEMARDNRVITGTICDHCGNTDHTHHDPTLADRAAIGRLSTLLLDADDLAVDVHELHRVYERYPDLDLAVGIALQD